MKRPLLIGALAAGSLHPFAPLQPFYFADALSSGASLAQRNRQRARPTAPGIKTNQVVVTASPVQTQADIVALADLRYDEWIANDNASDGDDNPSSDPPLPSRYAFRMATAEIAAERTEGGAVAFLAKLAAAGTQPTENTNTDGKNDDITALSRGVPVGSAELSPIEFDGAITRQLSQDKDTITAQQPTRLYVTDVVTSSKHRRMGIANTLMDALETFALEKFGTDTMLYLHVKKDNAAAQKFYQNPKRRYVAPTSEQLQNIDVRRLEDNAGTAGQILMCKSLLNCSLPVQQDKNDKDNVRGFGGASKGKTATKKSSKRKKR